MAGIGDTLDHAADDGGAWPAFTDLLAASTLIFLVLFAAIAIPALQRSEGAQRRERYLELVQAKLDTALHQQGVSVVRVNDYLLVRISENATFPRGADDISQLADSGKRILRAFGDYLRSDAAIMGNIDQVQVVGHASREGGSRRNWRLSSTRAATVALFLIDSVRLDPCKVTALGRSRYYPVETTAAALADTMHGRTADRRIELEVHPVVLDGRDGAAAAKRCFS